MSRPFQFKQFTVRQEMCAMKVGTDGVLLGAWAAHASPDNILDIGTGSGLIALMLAQRYRETQIDAIDIESSACLQAEDNFFLSPWKERLHIYNEDIFQFRPNKKYQLIVSNPPYFIDSTTTPQEHRTTARHCDQSFHHRLLIVAQDLLSDDGIFSVVLPVSEGKQLILDAEHTFLFPHKVCYVCPNPGKEAKRMLISFSKEKKNLEKEELIIEYSRHVYSKEYIDLTKEFYLKM